MAFVDDDECYVTIGTPFDIPEENEPLPKKSKVEDQIATDSKGRRRFHGAFTGGFSAGYFNSVGSKEGWAPSSFKSSRSLKDEKDSKVQYRPEDFMDEEDFAEHGIAPKKLKTTFVHNNSTDEDLYNERTSFLRAINDGEIHSALPGGADPLVDLLAPPKQSVGIQLLKKMGWKPGQGIGEKVDLSTDANNLVATKKVYGCALPPKAKVISVDDNSLKMMLAPKDIQPVVFNKKDNFHGIGYSGIVTLETRLRTTAGNLDQSFRPTGNEKKGIRGQAFGIGVFEEDDDDIYEGNSMSNYDMTMTDDKDDKHGWTGSMLKPKTHKDCLKGFIKCLKKLNIKTSPVTIQAPKEIPRHIFPDDKLGKEQTVKDSTEKHSKLTSKDRSNLLGETTESLDSVKHWTLKWDDKGSETKDIINENMEVNSSVLIQNKNSKTKTSRWDKDIEPVKPKKNNHPADNINIPSTKSDGFQPFSRYPEKQARYEAYLESTKKLCKPEFRYETMMTEWEKEQEHAEFARAATMYKPLTTSMASRFVRANFVDSTKKNDDDKPDDKKAAEMGMHGKLTRTKLDWHPDPILCKRMNIPNPYPNSKIKGVPSRNKKQSSFFSESCHVTKTITKPDDNKSVDKDEEEEDDFFSRIQKNKQKLLKSKSGPLSHLNIKLNCQKSTTENNPNNSDEQTSKNEKEIVVKPSIDIFKAIFENSDSENSPEPSDNEEKNEEQHSPNSNQVSTLDSSLEVKSKVLVRNENVIDYYSKNDLQNEGLKVKEKNKKNLPLAFLNPDQPSTKNDTGNYNTKVDERRSSIQTDETLDTYKKDSNLKVKEKNKKNLPLAFLNPDQPSTKNDTGNYNTKVDERRSSIQTDGTLDTYYKKDSNLKSLDSSKSKHERHKHKKRKKDKKSKKSKIKTQSSDNSDNESDNKKKKNHKNDDDSDSDSKYKKKKKKKYKSDDNENEIKEESKKKKSKRHRHSSSSSEGSLVPSNSVLLEKLKRISQSSRPKAADFM